MADLTLYGISEEFEYICDLLDKDVLSEDESLDLQKRFIDKLEHNSAEIIKFYRNSESQIESIKAEIASLTERRKKVEKRLETIKDNVTENMKRLNTPKISTAVGTLLIPNSVTLSVEVEDIEKVPKEYINEKVEVSVNKEKVKKFYKENNKDVVGTKVVSTPARVQFRKG